MPFARRLRLQRLPFAPSRGSSARAAPSPRLYSSNSKPPSPSSPSPSSPVSPPPSSSSLSSSSRAQRILARLPPSLQKYTRRLQGAPVSHVVAFLLLHEATAVVPLFGLFGLFHYVGAQPTVLDYMQAHYGEQVADGVRRFERYFRRKGWLGDEEKEEKAAANSGGGADDSAKDQRPINWTSGTYKIVAEVGLAYAITKVLLPVRVVVSLWATPWFAGVLGRASRLQQRLWAGRGS